MNTVYVIPNYECNLSCKHCSIHNMQCEYDEIKLFNAIRSFDANDNFILFGGEPTLFEDRCYRIVDNFSIKSISTNLLLMSQNLVDRLKEKSISISTSWNTSRFDERQYQAWLQKLKLLASNNMACTVMITMTNDLVADANLNKFLAVLQQLECTNAVESILFEHYVGEYATEQYNEECDKWLCKLHNLWKFKMKNAIEDKVLDWKFDCNDTYTIQPNGRILHQCPHMLNVAFNKKCLACEFASICKPCKLQKFCTFPKNLYYLLSELYAKLKTWQLSRQNFL